MSPAFVTLLVGVLLGYLLHIGLARLRAAAPKSVAEPAGNDASKDDDLYAVAERAEPHFLQIALPKDLLDGPNFQHGVRLLSTPDCSTEDLLGYATGDYELIACMALEALRTRNAEGALTERIMQNLRLMHAWPIFFALRAVKDDEHPVVGAVLAQSPKWWTKNSVLVQVLRAFAEERVRQGETPTFGARLEPLTGEELAHVDQLLAALDVDALAGLRQELGTWQRTRIDETALQAIGRVWSPQTNGVILEHPALQTYLGTLETTLLEDPVRSVLLVGPTGVGKTTLLRLLARRLQRHGWTLFEAGAADVLAGQVYIGQLEERVQELVRTLGGRKVLWVVPAFHELLHAGRHRYNPTGVLDMVLPFVENGTFLVVGETQPEAYERLLQAQPRLHTALDVLRLEPLGPDATLALAQRWADAHRADGPPLLAPETLQEAAQLVQQYLADQAAPGHLLGVLKRTRDRLAVDGRAPLLSLDDLLFTLSHLTGLPTSILDDRQGLDLAALAALFNQRVLGQPEAAACLVERVALIKAGLTDPTRPLGVFLFVGPTGTGKTELAKTLAEFLFGSPERMIRLDMSEFQTPESMARLLGEWDETSANTALVNLIRKQPFSVILLDEFEKAHPNVWDLFLQVFDDGRLTDRRGNTADFRHSIIILTSNLGASVPQGAHLGFGASTRTFAPGSVHRAVLQAFRPEFINRLDRVVVFRPLSRSVMREILHKELRGVLQRRGLRTREWAVEWDDAAIEFLLEQGFTMDLGARPLKRAIERYLLSPLALTIVSHQAPEGDQFLFVRQGGAGLEVEFIDPDAPDETHDAAQALPSEALDLRTLVLDAQGHRAEVEILKNTYEHLYAYLSADEWAADKQAGLARMTEPGFWSSPERFSVLADVEYMDRIEAGFATAGSLLQRLEGNRPDQRTTFPRDLVRRLAEQLYLLEAAHTSFLEGIPRDAFLLVEARPEVPPSEEASEDFARQLGRMYQRWARKRRMRHQVLSDGRRGGRYRLLMAISGFGAYALLLPEGGLHVLEVPREETGFRRSKARVRIAPQPGRPPSDDHTLLDQAQAAFGEEEDATPAIVRRYRKDPSPLVRDSVRQWRTGRLDRVLDGDFDVIS